MEYIAENSDYNKRIRQDLKNFDSDFRSPYDTLNSHDLDEPVMDIPRYETDLSQDRMIQDKDYRKIEAKLQYRSNRNSAVPHETQLLDANL